MAPRALICLDAQHLNKPNRPHDAGASADINGDGDVTWDEYEARFTREYFSRLRRRLEQRDFAVIDGFSGTYAERNRRADELGASLYIAGHMNAGGGDYGMVGVDWRAPRGGLSRFLAGRIADEWRARIPLGRVRVQDLRPRGWTLAGFNTIGRCVCPSLLWEPLFMDTPMHREMLNNEPERVLEAIAAGGEAAIVAAHGQGLFSHRSSA